MAVQGNALLVLANDRDGFVVPVVAEDGLRAAGVLNLRNRVVGIVLVCGKILTSIFVE